MDRRSKYSIQVIREALFELLEVKSLDEITVVDICSKADVNRGTFYKYYRDVPDLYDKTEDSLVNDIYNLLKKNTGEEPTNHFFIKDILNLLSTSKEFAYISKNKDFSERIAQKILVHFIPSLQQMLNSKCHNLSTQDSSLLLEYILGGCIRVVSFWLNDGMQASVDELEKILSALISHSLSIYE